MKIKNTTTEEKIIAELGSRLTKQRLQAGFTQAALAEKAGVSKRTIERIESGSSIQLSTLIQVLRVFQLLDGLNEVLPEKRSAPIKKEAKAEVKMEDKQEPGRRSQTWGYES